jgi:Sec7-like guanine-nucleotide exchange factor
MIIENLSKYISNYNTLENLPNITILQSYLDKINSHTWENKLLKSSLILATYVNYALIEYGETHRQLSWD